MQELILGTDSDEQLSDDEDKPPSVSDTDTGHENK